MRNEYRVLKYKWKYYMAIQLLIMFIIFISENFWMSRFRNTCILDGVGLLMNGSLFLLLYVIYLFYIINITKNDTTIQIILRSKNRKKIWLQEVNMIFVINGVTSLTWCMAGGISGYLHSDIILNWSEMNSFFSYTTSSQIGVCNLTYIRVVAIAWFAIMMFLNVISLIVLLGFWVFNNMVIGMLLILIMGFYDTWVAHSPIFFKRFIIYSDVWMKNEWILINIISLMVITAAISVIGLIIVDGKEFLPNA